MQKPADLDGVCPFLSNAGPCPYGLACRFAGTHKVDNGKVASANGDKKNSEMNVLTKDVQRLLWKNRMKFPKADAALKLLGLQVRKRLLFIYLFECIWRSFWCSSLHLLM